MSLRTFCMVAELKSFAAAGKRLNQSTAMVSKHVMRLESRLGTRLFNRTSRHVSLTESGALYFSQAKLMLEGLDEVEAAISNVSVSPRGTLKLSAPVWTASPCFVRMLAAYQERYPEVTLDMDLSGRIVHLVDEGFDLALRAIKHENLDLGLIARPLMPVEFILMAAPAYLARAGRPGNLRELNGHALLRFKNINENLTLDGPNGQRKVTFRSAMVSENETLLHLAALAGMGLVFLPKWIAEADLAAGRLETVLPEEVCLCTTLHAVYPSRKYLSAKVRTFIDFLAAQTSSAGGATSVAAGPSSSPTDQLQLETP